MQNYNLFKKSGILDYIETLNTKTHELDELLIQAHTMSQKRSVEMLVEYVIDCLSEKFIPRNLVFILNEGILLNKIKVLSYKNMKSVETRININTLAPYEKFFSTYQGTTSFLIFENEMETEELISPFRSFNPEIIVPINGFSGLYGVIIFGPKILQEEYSTEEISYIDRLMKFTASALQNNIHYDHSVKDAKTGLYNHSFYSSRVIEEVARSRRNRRPFSILIMDIDKFKFFNDTYGHMAGDEVILEIARKLEYTMREEDIISRFGGEEFTVLLPDSDAEAAWLAAERVRKEIESLTIDYKGALLNVTISLGAATYGGEVDCSGSELIRRADEALYTSKKTGRNKTTVYKWGLLQRAAKQLDSDGS